MPDNDKALKKPDRKQSQVVSEDRVGAASLAVKHLINPDEDKLVEVSFLPIGIVHSLTMLQAYEEQISTLVAQIRTMQEWYTIRALKKKYGEYWQSEQTREDVNGEEITEYDKIMNSYKELDKFEPTNLFIHRFRHAFYQTSRGRDGKFVESLTILSDTDLQTRSPDMEDAFRSPMRGQ